MTLAEYTDPRELRPVHFARDAQIMALFYWGAGGVREARLRVIYPRRPRQRTRFALAVLLADGCLERTSFGGGIGYRLTGRLLTWIGMPADDTG